MEIFYEIDGKSYWKCGWCSREHPATENGAYVKVGNVIASIVCEDPCIGETLEAIPAFLSNHADSVVAGATP